jgi:integrase
MCLAHSAVTRIGYSPLSAMKNDQLMDATFRNAFPPGGAAPGVGESLGFHSLRHTYSTMLRDLGVDVKVQQELMRHADIRATMNRPRASP